MNWDSLAAIAELLAAIGVIGSLIYVARQVSGSRKQARQAAIQSLQAQMNNVWVQMSAEERIADNFAKGSKGLSHLPRETDRLQFSAHMLSIFRPYEEIFHYHNNGLVDEWTWESISSQCQALMATQGFVEWWALRGGWFSKLFQEHVSEVLENLPEYKGWIDENLVKRQV